VRIPPKATKYLVCAECRVNSPPSLRRDSELARSAWGEARYCMDAFGCRPHSMALVRVLAHIKKLDDCFGDFLVRVSCLCGAQYRPPTRTNVSDD
jgi:hypothetical protein